MKTKPDRIPFAVLTVSIILLIQSTPTAFGYTHTLELPNDTGKNATDLHLTFQQTPRNISAPPFTKVDEPVHNTFDFSGGTVLNGGKVILTWDTLFNDPTILGGKWTDSTGEIGDVKLSALEPHIRYEDGTVVVSYINPTALALSYADLQVFTNVPDPQVYYTPTLYLSHANAGDAVPLLVPPSGFFAPGETDVATFISDLSGNTYAATSALFGPGELLVGAGYLAVPVPEPGIFGFIGSLGLFAICILRVAPRRSESRR